jgi:hypothetical protein
LAADDGADLAVSGLRSPAQTDAPIGGVDRPAKDDEQARGLRLLLLGQGAVFAHRFERSLTAEMDDEKRKRTFRGNVRSSLSRPQDPPASSTDP